MEMFQDWVMTILTWKSTPRVELRLDMKTPLVILHRVIVVIKMIMVILHKVIMVILHKVIMVIMVILGDSAQGDRGE